MIPEEVLKEIRDLTAELIAAGISVDQNFPSLRQIGNGDTLVGLSQLEDLSITLKNIPYAEAYTVLRENRSYNIRLIDGGMIQMLFTFRADDLIKQRLAFFPSPDLLEYQNNSEIYDLDELYADVTSRNVVTVPVRFDFDPQNFTAGTHPKSHLTIGQYKNCRIPVSAPLTPFLFMEFILQSFYNTPAQSISDKIVAIVPRFTRTIDPVEIGRVYINACGN